MGGFIKGIVVGLVSFVAGFAVLSVILPTPERGETPHIATPQPAPPAAVVPAIPPSTLSQAPAAESAEGSETVPPVTASAPSSAPLDVAGDAVMRLEDTEVVPERASEMPPPSEDSAPYPDPAPDASLESPVTPPAVEPAPVAAPIPPVTGRAPSPEPSVVEMTDASMVPPVAREDVAPEAERDVNTETTPAVIDSAPSPVPAPVELSPAPQVEPEEAVTSSDRPEIAPARVTEFVGPVADTASPHDSPFSEIAETSVTPLEAPPVEPAPIAVTIPPVAEDAQAAQPAPAEMTQEILIPPEAPIASPPDTQTTRGSGLEMTARPFAPEAPDTAPQDAALMAPVPALILPESEPLLTPPQPDPPVLGPPVSGPVVRPMPGMAAGAVVRRIDEASPAAPRPVEGITLGRLPAIGTAPAAPAPATEAAMPAVRRHAAQITIAEGTSALGLVLLESAESEAALIGLAAPVSIAMDPSDPDAPRRARAYRDAGHEIVLLAQGVPRLATASDVLVTLNAWMTAFPETVAVMDVAVNGIGAQRAVAREVAGQLAPDGYGAIALRDGLDPFLQAAREERLPAAPVYREIDGEGQSEVTIRRLIDRAAFEAQRQRGIVIVGSAGNPNTLAALASYRAQGRAGVVLAPVSSVLTGP